MECMSGVWSIMSSLWECSSKLEDNLRSLSSERFKLVSIKGHVNYTVIKAEEQQMKVGNQVKDWLESVEAVEMEVGEILQKGFREIGSKCLGNCCPKNCWLSYKIGKNVMKMIPRVRELGEEAQQFPPPPVDKLPMMAGFDSKFEKVWQSVLNNDSSVIGLVGMGGVGKTTLLKQLKNEFMKSPYTYCRVIWVVVSKPANSKKIRDFLRYKLGIPENTSEDETKSLIFSILKEKKFVVLLDDMWEGLKLSELGIPRPSVDSPGSKIVFTTRSREVWQSMEADNLIPVGCLPPDDAFSLFYSKLGKDILKSHPDMQGLIMDVVSECEGLPLALITIGCAMRGKTDARQWKEAKRSLQKYPSTFPGMEGVFSKLVFNYDNLPNPMVKKCFEYCSLYPEDHNILEQEVIRLWLAEEFIGEYDSMSDALIQGRQVMESLKQACLLETVKRVCMYNWEGEKKVKMHGVIRDMALWVARERGEKRNKFCVEAANGYESDITVAPNAMSNAEKISLRGYGITTESLARMSFCPDLTTLIIQDTRVEELRGEIVHSMNVLKVLDLAGNPGLVQFPIENGCLANLEYLNITGTEVKLPAEVSQWKKLRILIVEDTMVIPSEVISSLCSLQMFEQISLTGDLFGSVCISSERKSMERGMLSELEGLKHIMDVHLTLCSAPGIEVLLDSPKLHGCTTRLVVKHVDSPKLDFGTETLTKHLERLQFDYCWMSEVKLGRPSQGNNLCEVSFFNCYKIRNLNSLIYVPNLCILHVDSCDSITELVGEETRSSNVGTSLFSSLTSLTLRFSPKLRSICPQSALPFPSLEVISVMQCKNLVKLPLDSNTARTTPPEFCIRGQREWWDGLEWDSQATKDAFTPSFYKALPKGWFVHR